MLSRRAAAQQRSARAGPALGKMAPDMFQCLHRRNVRGRLVAFVIALAGVLGCAPCTPLEEPPGVRTGLPSSKHTYQAQRDRLVAADAALRFDADVELGAAEQRLNAHVVELRRSLIGKYRKEKRFPPSEPFHAVKDEIRRTALYKLLRKMPKGGVLHIHTSSTAPARWIVEEGILQPNCYVCWPNDEGDAIRGQLGFFLPEAAPPGYRAVSEVISQDPDFPRKLLPLITIGDGDEGLSNLEIWSKFNQIFQRVGGLVSYQPLYKPYYLAAFQSLLDDRVTYVELRAGMGGLYDLNGKAWDYREQARFLWEVRNQIRKSSPEFDLKLIYSGHRWVSAEKLWPQLERAVELRKRWARHHFIVGFDLVGEEDAGHTTAFFLADWIKLKSYLQTQKVALPLYFHDGESDWPSDTNLYDAYLLGSRRIGHGFNLFRFPTLQRRLKEKGIAVEICPISNQALRYVSDLRIHPASGYLNRGLPCVLGNDDPGIFGNDGLSYDYWQAVVAWKLDLRSIKQLALNSLTYSAMTETEKSAAIDGWQATWNSWVARQCAMLP